MKYDEKKVERLGNAVRAILSGDHFWDYHKWLENNGEQPEAQAKKTEAAVNELSEALDDL